MIENTKQNILLFFSSNFCICFDIWISRITITQLICHDFGAKTWNLSFKTNSTQTTDTHRECKDWFAKVALQKLKAQTEISDSYLFFEMTYLPRKRAQRKVIDRPTCWFVIDWLILPNSSNNCENERTT